jgi:hypothetical protein
VSDQVMSEHQSNWLMAAHGAQECTEHYASWADPWKQHGRRPLFVALIFN